MKGDSFSNSSPLESGTTEHAPFATRADDGNSESNSCVLDDLFRFSFGSINLKVKQNVIKIGRPMPDMLLNIKMKKYVRHLKKRIFEFLRCSE